MERVTNQQNTIEVFENEIDMFLKDFCEENQIEDMKKESQSVWNAALMYINKYTFKGTNKLKDSNLYNINNNNISSNFNQYNYKLVSEICDIYIYLCSMYDKEVSIIGFSRLTGIDNDTICAWGNDSNKLSSSSSIIYKKLSQAREESLSNKLATGKQNPVGVLAILNRHYSWNLPGVSREQASKGTLTAEQLPQFNAINGTNNVIECKDMHSE